MITALSNAPVVVQGPEVITSTTPGLGVSSSTAASQAAVSSNTTGTQTLYYPLDTYGVPDLSVSKTESEYSWDNHT